MQATLPRQHAHIEPIQGFECPLDYVDATEPVYLKTCGHFFNKPAIELFFRLSFEKGEEANCPVCRHAYFITNFLHKHGNRDVAIQKIFEKIIVPALVPGEINEKLESTAAECNRLMINAQELTKTHAEQYNQLVVKAQELAETAKENEAMIAKQAVEINDLRTDLKHATDKIKELNIESSFYQKTTSVATTGLVVAVGYIAINAKLKS